MLTMDSCIMFLTCVWPHLRFAKRKLGQVKEPLFSTTPLALFLQAIRCFHSLKGKFIFHSNLENHKFTFLHV